MNAEILQFLSELRENNYREWFQDNKKRYDLLRKAFIEEVQLIIDHLALFDSDIAGVQAKDCLFRIYRDIRFSPDKTPYKTHFSAYIAQGGRKSERTGYYFHLEPGSSLLSGGSWAPPSPLLKKLRREIFTHIDDFLEIIENPDFKTVFSEFEGEQLKRNPVGFPDSQYNYIIRQKNFSVASFKSDSFFLEKDWLDKTVTDFKTLHPFNRFLNSIIDEHLGKHV